MNKIPEDRYFPIGMGKNEKGIKKEENWSLSEILINIFQSIFGGEILLKTKENSGETIYIYKSSAVNYLKAKTGQTYNSGEEILRNLENLKKGNPIQNLQREPIKGILTVKDGVETRKKSVSWGGNVRDTNTISNPKPNPKPKRISANQEKEIFERKMFAITADEAGELGKLNERIVDSELDVYLDELKNNQPSSLDETESRKCKKIGQDIKTFLSELEKSVEKKAEELGITNKEKINAWKKNKISRARSKLSID